MSGFGRFRALGAQLLGVGSLAIGGGASHALPGDLDGTFGNGGRVRFTHTQSNSTTVHAAARMSDGRIVIAAQCVATTGNVSFCLSRISANGMRDTAFERSWHHSNALNRAAIPYAIAVDRQDRILVAGQCVFTATGGDMCVARFLANGQIDASFGFGSGFAAIAFGPGANADQATAIVLTADDKIVLGGSCDMGGTTGTDFCLAKLNANGERDTAFGVDGRVTHSWDGSGIDLLHALLQDWQGGLYAGGSCQMANGERYFCLMGISSVGSAWNFKRAYGVSPTATTRTIRAMAFTYDEKLLLAGRCSGGVGTGIDFCTIRVNTNDHSVDTSFGTNGTRVTAIGYQALDDSAHSIYVQPDGRILVAGTCGLNPSTAGDAFCFARYAPDGQEDRSINSNTDGVGSVFTEFQSNATNDRASVVLPSANGGFVLVGHCERTVGGNQFDVCAAKYQSGTNLHAHCTSDIDGDGTFNPLIDGLIISRIAAGMRDQAVTNGIATPAHALRQNWNAGIALYLDHVCGVRGLSYTSLISQ
jgi:uncharacterized delta-60 repeat protein